MTLSGLAQGVVINLFMLLGFVAFFSMARRWSATRLRLMPAWANGLLFGAMAVLAMLVSSVTSPGVMFDCRSGVIGAGALLGGPVCALASVLFPCLYRLHVGGLGLIPGLLEIILPAALGSLCYWLCRSYHQVLTLRRAVLHSLLVGVGVNVLTVGSILVFMHDQDLLLDTGSSVLIFFYCPLSMVLFTSLLVLERQHTESMELHSSILQTAMEGFWLVDNQGCLLEVNEAYCRMSGYSEAELQTKSIADLEASMTGSEVAGRIQDTQTKGCQRFESTHRRKDGSTFSVGVSVQSLPDKSGRLVCFLRDITDRKKAEVALQESERKYKQLIETTNTGFVILDEKGVVLDANQEYVRLTGNGSLDDIRGRPVTDWTAPWDQKRNAMEVKKCVQTGGVRNLEVDYVDARGQVTPIEVHANVLPDGVSSLIMTVCRDITERRLAVEEKGRLNAQLVQAQKMEAVGRLAGGVAHDLNNMLGVVLALSDMARRGLIPEAELKATFEQIQDAGQRSANLTQQLLAFARKQTIVPRVLDLNENVERMLKMLRRLLGEDVELIWRPGARLDSVFIDPTQIDQILANLCVNARDAIGPKTGRICIETGMVEFDEGYCSSHVGVTPGHYAMLAVSDNGCGMDGPILAHIFEPFFTTKGVGVGTGLGLATVYGIVKQNNGSIDVQSEVGKGSTFRIYLPRYAVKTGETVESADPAAMRGGDATVLLVEDETALLRTVEKMLNQLGYTVLAAEKPSEALRLARNHPNLIHLLITDVVMPEMNGRDLAEQLAVLRPKLKFLFMSGHTADVIAHRGVLDKGVHFLQKPFLAKDLASKVKAVLES